MASFLGVKVPFFDFLMGSEWRRRAGEPGICDFVTGNSQELPLPAFGAALRRGADPHRPDWFSYKMNEPASCAVVAASLQARLGVAFRPRQILMTNGAIAGLAVALRALTDPGEEVLILCPPFFAYEPMVRGRGATPVLVHLTAPDFALDLDAVAEAITPRTRAIILNSPHNPTGRVYAAAELEELGAVLEQASQRYGRPVYLLSDEAFSRLVFDGRHYDTPTKFYAKSLLIYTYSKTLLTPGERLGFLAIPPDMPDPEAVQAALFMAQIGTGWAFPNAVLQHALADIDGLSIDVAQLQAKRDRMVEGLRGIGYETSLPEGTFYMIARAPIADDNAFCAALAKQDIFVLPGSVMELPGYFRISLTATEDMIERSLPGFEKVWTQASD
jgi:aspartate aminotransferase